MDEIPHSISRTAQTFSGRCRDQKNALGLKRTARILKRRYRPVKNAWGHWTLKNGVRKKRDGAVTGW